MQHLQSLSRHFSKFDTKFNVDSLLNRHSVNELPYHQKTQSDLAQQFFTTSNQSHSNMTPKKQK